MGAEPRRELTALETQVFDLIEEEVTRRVNIRSQTILEEVSRLYEIPIERLIKDTARLEGNFCKGINKRKERCLKKPLENGYCKFHKCQAPQHTKPAPKTESVPAPWDT